MATSSALQQQLAKLDIAGPVQHYAIAAIFDAACQGASSPPSPPAEAAMQQCLCLPDGQAAGVAVTKLLEMTEKNRLPHSTAQSLLLTALAVATPAAAVPLGSAAVTLWAMQLNKAKPSSSSSWKAHLLSKCLRISPSAGPSIISGVCRLLTKAALATPGTIKNGPSSGHVDYVTILSSLRPFLCSILLDPTVSTQHSQLATTLCSSLVRTAAALDGAPAAQHAMLSLLCSFLPGLQVRTVQQQGAAEAFVADVMELLESCQEEPDFQIVDALITGLLNLCDDVSQCGGGISSFLAALAAVASYWAPAVRAAAPMKLAALAAKSPEGDAVAALSLLSSLLQPIGDGGISTSSNADMGCLHPCYSAGIAVQLIPSLAFSQVSKVKEWTSYTLRAVQTSSSEASAESLQDGGSSSLLLSMLWQDPRMASHWLRSLENELSSLSTSSGSSSGASISPPTATAMLCLLHHPDAAVSLAAVDAIIAAVHAAPLLGITVLPIFIHRLHNLVETFFNGKKDANGLRSSLLLPTIYALPRLATHPSAVPFIARAVQPLLAPPAPDLLQAVALRMLCEMWTTTGRGFAHLRTALLSYAAPAGGRSRPITPQMAEDPALRQAWAATLVEVCAQDGARAAELVHSITECLEDSAPEIQAAGLECIAELCEADTLDFYKAWKVVRPAVPTLPMHPSAGASWLRLLASGCLDAGVYPEIAKGIVRALWAATKHPEPAVRAQACASLAAYDFIGLEAVEALCLEMWEIAALLQERNDLETASECEELVVHALKYEHATRRRQLQTGKAGRASRFRWGAGAQGGGAGDGTSAGGVTLHRLASSLPRALLGPGSRDKSEFLRRLPDVSPAAVLLLWAPPPPPAQATTSQRSAARHAAEAYASVYSEVCKYAESGFEGDVGAEISAWTSFVRRWSAACRDAAEVSITGPAERTAAGVQSVWAIVKSTMNHSSVAVASSAACAAAALAGAHPQPVKAVVEEVFAELSQRAQHVQQGMMVQATACAALGHCADVARSVVGLPAAHDALAVLQGHVTAVTAAALLRARSVTGLGLACRHLAKAAVATPNVSALVRDTLCTVLGVIVPYFPPNVSDDVIAALWDPTLYFQEISAPPEVLHAALAIVADAMPAVLAVRLPTLLPVLRLGATQLLQGSGADPAAASAACSLLRAATLNGFKQGVVSGREVEETLTFLKTIAVSGKTGSTTNEGGQLPNGKFAGAGAATLGALVPGLVREGFSFVGEGSEQFMSVNGLLEAILESAEGAVKMSGIAAAVQGAGAGIAAMIRGRVSRGNAGEVSLTKLEKKALEMLESLALKSDDTRIKKSCSRALAELCYSARQGPKDRSGGADDDLAHPSASSQIINDKDLAGDATHVKGISLLPENGALRYLCETAVAGVWPVVSDDDVDSDEESDEARQSGKESGEERKKNPAFSVQQPTHRQKEEERNTSSSNQAQVLSLSSTQAASLLRCLAAAPRLPALDWSSACRRLVRAHPGNAGVQEACISFAAAHAAVSQAYQLYDFVSGDVLVQPDLSNWCTSAQITILDSLPRLLAALPDAEAVSVLRMLCDQCPEGANGAEWQAALLQGLAAVAEEGRRSGTSTNTNTASSSLVAQTSWECAVHIVLPKLPTPSTWPVSVKLLSSSTLEESTTPPSPTDNNNAWWALLRCALAAPYDAIIALCQNITNFKSHPLHWIWLSAAITTNSGTDLRALQQPRNLVVNGNFGNNSESEEAAILWIVRALTAAPGATSAQQQQWIGDVLHAADKCTAPVAAVKLAACGAVALACSSAATNLSGANSSFSESSGLALNHAVLVNCAAALQALPTSVRQIAEAIEPCPVVLLGSLVEAISSLPEGKDLQRRCCFALRGAMVAEVWMDLCQKLKMF